MVEPIYEDNHLLVVDKRAGLLTQPSGTTLPSLETELKEWIKMRDQKPGGVFLEAIHRLDRAASGIVIFAKTRKALSRLNASMRAQQIKKWYLALTEGIPTPPEGDLEHFLLHGDRIAHVVAPHTPGAKSARLHYRLIHTTNSTALLNVTLHTGRYHQIRAQLAAIGCPILGDHKYGATSPLDEGIALHHYLIQFPHPTTQDIVTLETPAPSHWPPLTPTPPGDFDGIAEN